MWIRELATGWERVYKPSEHASASVIRGTRDAVPTISISFLYILYIKSIIFFLFLFIIIFIIFFFSRLVLSRISIN
jgi:hypothetical protein